MSERTQVEYLITPIDDGAFKQYGRNPQNGRVCVSLGDDRLEWLDRRASVYGMTRSRYLQRLIDAQRHATP